MAVTLVTGNLCGRPEAQVLSRRVFSLLTRTNCLCIPQLTSINIVQCSSDSSFLALNQVFLFHSFFLFWLYFFCLSSVSSSDLFFELIEYHIFYFSTMFCSFCFPTSLLILFLKGFSYILLYSTDCSKSSKQCRIFKSL